MCPRPLSLSCIWPSPTYVSSSGLSSRLFHLQMFPFIRTPVLLDEVPPVISFEFHFLFKEPISKKLPFWGTGGEDFHIRIWGTTIQPITHTKAYRCWSGFSREALVSPTCRVTWLCLRLRCEGATGGWKGLVKTLHCLMRSLFRRAEKMLCMKAFMLTFQIVFITFLINFESPLILSGILTTAKWCTLLSPTLIGEFMKCTKFPN